MDLNDLEKEMSRIIQEEIDKEAIIEIKVWDLQDKGWTLVSVNDRVDYTGIEEWVGSNLKDEWRSYNERWLFKDPQDAILFKMTWL